MREVHENPFDTLSELELNTPTEFDLISEKEIRAELRFSEDTIDVGRYDITVTLSSAILHLTIRGGRILPGSRVSEVSRAQIDYDQTIRKRATVTKALEVGARLGASNSNSSATLSGTKSGSTEDEVELEIKQSISRQNVRTLSGNRWRIQESDANSAPSPLDGAYIANEVLCIVSPLENANTLSVEACLAARKKDFLVTPSGNSLMKEIRERTHKEKFMSAIIAKCLIEGTGQQESAHASGNFIISRSSLSLDDDA